MKLVAFLFALTLAISAHAADPKDIQLTCVTQPATTAFFAGAIGEDLVVRMVNFHGMDFTPALSGNFTPHDLPTLSQYAEAARLLNSDMHFKFNLKKCVKGEGLLFECLSANEVQTVNGAKVETIAFYTMQSTVQMVSGTYLRLMAHLTLYVNGKILAIEMPFSDGDCIPVTTNL